MWIFTAQPLWVTWNYVALLVFPLGCSALWTTWMNCVCLMIFWHRHNQDCDERLCSHLKYSWIVIVLYWSYQTKVPRIGAKTWFVSFQILFVFRDWKTDIFDKQRALKFKAKQEEEKGFKTVKSRKKTKDDKEKKDQKTRKFKIQKRWGDRKEDAV